MTAALQVAPCPPAVLRHVRVCTVVHRAGQPSCRLQALHRVDQEVPAVFEPLIRFFLETGKTHRLAFQKSVARSVLLLLDHLAARETELGEAGPDALQAFVDELVAGTVDARGRDVRGLYWLPRSVETAHGHLQRVTAFADWLVQRMGQQALNPWRTARPEEKLAALRRFDRRKAAALLSHAAVRRDEPERAARARQVQQPLFHTEASEIYAFDETEFRRFLEVGWQWRPSLRFEARHHRLRNLMISLLLHAGGIRLSEAFHIFVGDVVANPDRPGHALVWLFHPERGEAPTEPGGPWRDRKHYLSARWGLEPRNCVTGRFHAGWKNLALTDSRRRASRVSWHPVAWGETFWQLYADYVRLRPDGEHPYLFVSERCAQRGEPYTADSFRQAHERAVKRAGLDYGKGKGTSPHGHRHAYGTRLTKAKVERRHIARAMHHRNLFSQDVYSQPSHREVDEAIRAASDGTDAANSADLPLIAKPYSIKTRYR